MTFRKNSLTLSLLCTGALMLGIGLSSPAHATVVNFDDLTGDGTVADGYGGITWGGTWNFYDGPQFPYTPSSDFTRVYDYVTEGFFTLNTPGVFNGAYFAGTSGTTVQFNLYDASSNLLGSSSILGMSDTPTFLASGYSGVVSKVGVVSNNPDFFVMDDVTYDAGTVNPAVPEPGTIALIATFGLSGAGLLVRRRRATK